VRWKSATCFREIKFTSADGTYGQRSGRAWRRCDKLGKKTGAPAAYEKFPAVSTDKNSDMYFAAAERARNLRRGTGKK
jgi:hypothetical protein